MKKTDIFSFVLNPTVVATNKLEFLFMFLIVTPILYVLLILAIIAFLAWAFSLCGLVYAVEALSQGNYITAGFIVLVDIVLLVFYIMERLKVSKL